MSYGLDFSECRFVTDHKGNRLRADIPYNMFSMLVEFRQAASRAQTEQIEKSVRPGTYKGSLGTLVDVSVTQQAAPQIARPTMQSQTAPLKSIRDRLEALFSVPLAVPVEDRGNSSCPAQDAAPQNTSPRSRRVYFPREFCAPIPVEVADAITNGTYFLRAWREYRKYKSADSAELTGLSIATIGWHEQGYNIPSKDTLERFANIYDCTLEQLIGISSSTRNKVDNKVVTHRAIKMAPTETDYPDTVLGHIVSGKSPVTAWRVFRGMTEKQLAERYGTSVSLLRQMTESQMLSDRTLDKLGVIFHCTRDQLRRPDGLVVEPHKVRPTAPKRLVNAVPRQSDAS